MSQTEVNSGTGIRKPRIQPCLGSNLTITDYAGALELCIGLSRSGKAAAVEFANTHIVSLRRSNPEFRRLTDDFDHIIPDCTPLMWLLNAHGAGMKDRVYGPAFMDHALRNSPGDVTHFLLGGSERCGDLLREKYGKLNPDLRIVGSYHGKCDDRGSFGAEDGRVLESLRTLKPDLIWVGLGAPKQERCIMTNKKRLEHGVLMALGQAFDVNAGLRKDAPKWMQKLGLTWLYRMASEPRRLVGRYLRHNTEFLFYLTVDGIRGRIFR